MSRHVTVLFDGYCTMCRASARTVDRLDWFRLIRWIPFQAREAETFGIPREVLEATMCTISGVRRWFGFTAWKQILLRLPILYLLIAGTAWVSPWLVLLWVAFFAPVAEPIGQRVYEAIARNRHKIPGSTCQRQL